VPLHVPAWPEKRRPSAGEVRYFYGIATQRARKARERPVGPDGPVRGIFTQALLAALKHAPPDDQGNVTGSAFEDYVFNYLQTMVGEGETYQEPIFDYNKRRDIVLVHKTKSVLPLDTVGVEIELGDAFLGQPIEILKYNLEPAHHLAVATARWQVRLPQGIYMVHAPDSDKEHIFEVIGQEAIHVNFS
jgi:hypothetical protein